MDSIKSLRKQIATLLDKQSRIQGCSNIPSEGLRLVRGKHDFLLAVRQMKVQNRELINAITSVIACQNGEACSSIPASDIVPILSPEQKDQLNEAVLSITDVDKQIREFERKVLEAM
jgi:hypothetical protein